MELTWSIGTSLAAARRRMGLTQTEIARLLGRRQSLVSRWETGTRAMTLSDFQSYCLAVSLIPDEVLRSMVIPGDVRHRSSRANSIRQRVKVGARLAAARVHRGLSPIDVWRSTGLTPYRLGCIERGKDATLAELQRLLPLLGVTVSEVVADAP